MTYNMQNPMCKKILKARWEKDPSHFSGQKSLEGYYTRYERSQMLAQTTIPNKTIKHNQQRNKIINKQNLSNFCL